LYSGIAIYFFKFEESAVSLAKPGSVGKEIFLRIT
jgi:hypothetical protein